MKKVYAIALASLAAALLIQAAGDPAAGAADKKDAPATQPAKKKKSADNSYCLVCHANYEEEKLTRTHAKAGVGCEKCHGKSSKHSSDEDSLIPPEVMFPREKIKPFCMTCHDAKEMMEEEEEDHKEILQANPPASAKTCTQCHGKHQLKVRTRVWDKATGKLLRDDGVRMMNQQKSASQPAKDEASAEKK